MSEIQKRVLNRNDTKASSPFKDINGLLKYLKLEFEDSPYPILEKPKFRFLCSRDFADLMEKNNWYDPLLLQVLPRQEELISLPGFLDDPVGDGNAQAAPNLIHKYKNRVLLLTTSACAQHCRYCFRKEFPYKNIPFTPEQWIPAWNYILNHTEVDEVILSGGDPLMLDNSQLKELVNKIAAISHIKSLRIHTRIPVTNPSRIAREMLNIFEQPELSHLRKVLVIQANHAHELGDGCVKALMELRSSGFILYNQSVLLKDVNDSPQAQKDLLEVLIDHHVKPYYCHQLDRVKGTHHFEVEEERGILLYQELMNTLPGYILPVYVREVPGAGSKVRIV